jgi:8-oxo-dGTP diphosphatase
MTHPQSGMLPRTTWDVPGGIVEADESPYAACRREVAEEIGLDLPVGRILALDWVPVQSPIPEELILIYDGGVLTPAEIAVITVPAGELKGFGFFNPEDPGLPVRPTLHRRIQACLRALATGATAELEDGNQACASA